jgi:hypothetical protein
MKENYVRVAIREFKQLQSLADSAMGQLSDEQFFELPAPVDKR